MKKQSTRKKPTVSRRDFVLGACAAGATLAMSACSEEGEDAAVEDADDSTQEDEGTATAAMIGAPWVSSNLLGNLSADFEPGPEAMSRS